MCNYNLKKILLQLAEAGSLFYNHKQFLSRVFQDVADHESRCVFIDKGAYGQQSDDDTYSALHFVSS
jgi:hypothetical protein